MGARYTWIQANFQIILAERGVHVKHGILRYSFSMKYCCEGVSSISSPIHLKREQVKDRVRSVFVFIVTTSALS